MVNEEKVRIMTNIAMYEQREGRRQLPISKYYRIDYIGLALIKNFFLITICYVLIIAAVFLYFSEFFMENLHKMNLVNLGIYVIGGYVILLAVYSVVTYIRYSVKYFRAKKSVKKYYQDLTALSKLYAREEKRDRRRRSQGGYDL